MASNTPSPTVNPWSLTVTAGPAGSSSTLPFTHARTPALCRAHHLRRPRTHHARAKFVSQRASAKVLTRFGHRYHARRQADVAQLVERNLAKVEVASSSLVVRSERVSADPSTVGWPRGEATDCKSVYTGSNPVPTSNPFEGDWRSGSALP